MHDIFMRRGNTGGFMTMKGIRLLVPFVLITILITISGASYAQEGRATFRVFDNDPAVVELSKKIHESGTVFKDKDGDGIYDTVKAQGQELYAKLDTAAAYGVTYVDGKSVVFYPSEDASIPKPGEFGLYGFIHYFDKQGTSLYFAVVVQTLSDKELEGLKRVGAGGKAAPAKKGAAAPLKRVTPYRSDFIDSNGLRVGIPTLLLLPNSRLTYNAEFQKFYKSKNTVMLATNPAAPSRELYIFRKVPNFPDNLLLIHYKWY